MSSKHRNKTFSLSTSQVQQACFTRIFMIWSPLILSDSVSYCGHLSFLITGFFMFPPNSISCHPPHPLPVLSFSGILISHLGPGSFVPSVTTSAIAHKSLNLEGWSLFPSLFDLVISNSLLLPQPPHTASRYHFL